MLFAYLALSILALRGCCISHPAYVGIEGFEADFYDQSASEWRERVIPLASDLIDGILHASLSNSVADDTTVDTDCFNAFDIPIFVISDPNVAGRRWQISHILKCAGFANVTFPRYIPHQEVNVNKLIEEGLLSGSMESIKTGLVGDNWPRALSLILNHLHCIQLGLSTGREMFGVFEDDLMLGASPNKTRVFIANCISELPATADLLYLEYCHETCGELGFYPRLHNIAIAHNPNCAASILFTAKGARRVLGLMSNMSLVLDGSYSTLIAQGKLQAFLATPPAFFQDGFWTSSITSPNISARGRKPGERAIPGWTHRPYSLLCKEMQSDLFLSPTQVLPASVGSDDFLLIALDSFADLCRWPTLHEFDGATIHYFLAPAAAAASAANADGAVDAHAPFFSDNATDVRSAAGLLRVWELGRAVALEVLSGGPCWSDLSDCAVIAALIGPGGQRLAARVVRLEPRNLVDTVPGGPDAASLLRRRRPPSGGGWIAVPRGARGYPAAPGHLAAAGILK
jgi:hypothetical protein